MVGIVKMENEARWWKMELSKLYLFNKKNKSFIVLRVFVLIKFSSFILCSLYMLHHFVSMVSLIDHYCYCNIIRDWSNSIGGGGGGPEQRGGG